VKNSYNNFILLKIITFISSIIPWKTNTTHENWLFFTFLVNISYNNFEKPVLIPKIQCYAFLNPEN